MRHWHECPMALFNTGTTGIDPREARIVTAAIVETAGRSGTPPVVREWMLDPGVEIPEGASAIHGITTERAREDGMDAAAGVHEIAEHLLALSRAGVPVVGVNVAHDLTLLWAELDRHGDPIADDVRSIRPVIDALVLDKRVDRYRRGKRTLIDLARHYGVHLDEADAHGATADAIAAGRVALCIAEQSMEVRHMSLDELHRAQAAWKHEQASSLADYWRKQGDPRADEVSSDWPVQGRAS